MSLVVSYIHHALWLALYFAFSLAITLHNKLVLAAFPFPYVLTAIHALSGILGCRIMLLAGAYVPVKLSFTESAIMALFSILYTVNILVSNLSLQLVTVPVSSEPYPRHIPLTFH
jgi:hypothetical protein